MEAQQAAALPATSSHANGTGNIPKHILAISPVSATAPERSSRASSLPLNLIALIISYLDDLADIARVTRTSRLLYYMTLPQLYKNVILRSHSEIRYKDGRPEGFGGGSPFSMALNGLVTSNNAPLVQHFAMQGHWQEFGHDEFAQGRVPDNSMILNIVLRAAVDRMVKMESFSWELDSKPLKTIYQGLSLRPTLTSLTIRFPTNRSPRPTVMIPPIANLRAFKAMSIDPLCYPDDFSSLLLHSKKLKELRLHWSPRMRNEAEPSLSLYTYFGKCLAAKYRMPIEYLAFQNFFGLNDSELTEIWDTATLESTTFIDTFGGLKGDPNTVFVDDTWKRLPSPSRFNIKVIRCNELAIQHVQLLSQYSGLERMYFINAKREKGVASKANVFAEKDAVTTLGELSETSTVKLDQRIAGKTAHPKIDGGLPDLGKEYLHVLTTHHGCSLEHLLLSDHWSLGEDEMAHLVRCCPNLTQLGLALDTSEHQVLRLLVPFLPKLIAIRILDNGSLRKDLAVVYDERRMKSMSRDMWEMGRTSLKWIGIGDKIYQVGGDFQAEDENGNLEWRREINAVGKGAVNDVEIWKLDALEI
ncbi:hypothetical protein LTR50_001237 [Elasticomyces elasticus]|nr:hypothetical protein LTR50_001237 [Elasticomyces elasticus]